MSAHILDAINGIITVEITGKISPTRLAATQAKILETLQQWDGGTILTICKGFEGWANADWSDPSFQRAADSLIRKMAIIGNQQWEHMPRGLRPFPIKFFPHDHLREAHAWLLSSTGASNL